MENEFFTVKEFLKRLNRIITVIERKKTPYGLIKVWENRLIDLWPLAIGLPDLGGSGDTEGKSLNDVLYLWTNGPDQPGRSARNVNFKIYHLLGRESGLLWIFRPPSVDLWYNLYHKNIIRDFDQNRYLDYRSNHTAFSITLVKYETTRVWFSAPRRNF